MQKSILSILFFFFIYSCKTKDHNQKQTINPSPLITNQESENLNMQNIAIVTHGTNPSKSHALSLNDTEEGILYGIGGLTGLAAMIGVVALTKNHMKKNIEISKPIKANVSGKKSMQAPPPPILSNKSSRNQITLFNG